MNDPQVYLRFLNLLHTLEGSGQMSDLDTDSRKLLELIALKHHQQKAMTVSDAMGLVSIASPATIHRKLDALRDLGLVDTVFEGNNRRTKFLVPTPKALTHFAGLGQAMQQALGPAT
ncbi:MAG: MarR family transcriptional regulator [Betaproteobacteria bacterium]|nr:MarR family transcriptional regulator [Betaproteobacteria bacterium]